MHTQEQRTKAVELFIETGFNYAAVIATLGYSSRWSLDRWYADYLEKGYVKEKREHWEKFSEEEKKIAVDTYFKNNRHLSNTVKELGYPSRALLCKWIDEIAPGKRKKIKSHKKYNNEQKVGILASIYADKDSTIEESVKQADIDKVTFYNWRNTLLDKETQMKIEDINIEDLPDDIDELKRQIEVLKKELYQYQLEIAVHQAAAELIKKDQSANLKNLTNKDKTILVGALKNRFAITDLLNTLNLSKSSYYYQLEAQEKPDKYQDLRVEITRIFNENNAAYGYRRIWGNLRTSDNPNYVSEKVVRKIMHEEKLEVIYNKKKKRWSSYQGEISDAPENIVERNFTADKPNKLWLTDITQFSLADFKCYLSPIIDCFDGKVVSWEISKNPNAHLVNSMLSTAITTLKEEDQPICHSDRGCHYRWPGWIDLCDKNNITRSMSKKGCSPDNSACEGFFGRLKNEFFYYRSWEGVTYEEFVSKLNSYIMYYNETRIKQSLGWMSPNQYRRSLGYAS